MVDRPNPRVETDEVFSALATSGLTQRDFAAAIGIDSDKVSKTKSGLRLFKASELLKAREVLGIGTIPAQTKGLPVIVPAKPDIPPTIKAEDGSVSLRQIDLGFSMGDGTNLDDYVEEGHMEFDTNLLRSLTRSPPERLFVARGDGDSMFPTLQSDDVVVIDTLQTRLNLLDRVWALTVHGAGAIKRLRAIGTDTVLVISDNEAIPNQEVQADDLRIMGRVIWVGRKI